MLGRKHVSHCGGIGQDLLRRAAAKSGHLQGMRSQDRSADIFHQRRIPSQKIQRVRVQHLGLLAFSQKLGKKLGIKIIEISALKSEGIYEVADEAVKLAGSAPVASKHYFSGEVEHAIAHIEEAVLHDLPEEQQRWYAIKLFERDAKAIEQLGISEERMRHIENDIVAVERELDDDA